ncbi:MAG: hypothetical protein UY26_C0003G0219 [Candidatus Jorgensenbacteria bacterium GW2011_GWA1_48_13]|uniref:Uncharacterized protein n=1 Tax=Candidatus Jorgensenbacteria bacterium GW2011_GWB1_50_10 TaxID=1618665 RepID=A0A0G1Z885_9BACT|nr:MAG: hypothetical protein UX26_C0020G0008 [Parcubacteria group bacterium GW2011_GWC1_45_9]KKU94069.1 MAG: hypothetical protein UY26_C0003G0219 [Candidatus Jorgensenbacteria bacterium GW2011_GWA1_48_13]KKW15174.1 MAG: hypothetical protein UY55_C0002G0232 [Candidatus Jorgensenbacteria bacterium GW2011_GWB1_50_10]
MSTQILVKKLNKEVKVLRRDVSEVKAILLKILAIPEERLKGYRNAAAIKKSLEKALRNYPRA